MSYAGFFVGAARILSPGNSSGEARHPSLDLHMAVGAQKDAFASLST